MFSGGLKGNFGKKIVNWMCDIYTVYSVLSFVNKNKENGWLCITQKAYIKCHFSFLRASLSRLRVEVVKIYKFSFCWLIWYLRTDPTKFICSKSTIETPEKVWCMFKINNKDTKTTSVISLWPFSIVSTIHFDQVNVYWRVTWD